MGLRSMEGAAQEKLLEDLLGRDERLAVAYVGAVPRPTDVEPLTDRDPSSTNARLPSEPGVPRRVHVPDSDPRAVAYVMGAAPNRLGVLADGRTLVERLLGTSDLS